jgi:hypothetical protein
MKSNYVAKSVEAPEIRLNGAQLVGPAESAE